MQRLQQQCLVCCVQALQIIRIVTFIDKSEKIYALSEVLCLCRFLMNNGIMHDLNLCYTIRCFVSSSTLSIVIIK